jgi:hypothetical protein
MRNWISTLTVALLAAATITLLVPASAFAQQKQTGKRGPAQPATSEGKSMTDPPISCNLFGLTAAERLRQQELHKQLFSRDESVRELPNGYAVGLPATKENILAVAEFISLERVCCSFFRFELEVGRQEEPVWLRITGGEGVKEFLKTQFKLK